MSYTMEGLQSGSGACKPFVAQCGTREEGRAAAPRLLPAL